ncbi:hypothetical protein HGM15179_004371 [Zosterops borbonicus]|uniref:Uncharacterized protein n=1 Tax=Zosterops borbonicus TaxID=364589 RepID=A0A8K1LR63_9PASS|nr:hypothetical protein HGM15179_004371 [Zosterops borbonicus]
MSSLRKQADVFAKLLSMIFEKSWQSEIPGEWKNRSIVPIFQKDRKVDPGYCPPVSITSVPGEDHGTDPPRHSAMAHQGQEGDLGQPVELYQGQFLPHQPMAFYDGVTASVGPIADRFLTTKIVAVFTETERTHLAPCYYWVQGEEAVAASGSGCSLCHCQLAALNTQTLTCKSHQIIIQKCCEIQTQSLELWIINVGVEGYQTCLSKDSVHCPFLQMEENYDGYEALEKLDSVTGELMTLRGRLWQSTGANFKLNHRYLWLDPFSSISPAEIDTSVVINILQQVVTSA